MTQTTARIKKAGNHFEIMVDLEKALKYKKGESSSQDFLEIDRIFSDSKKGMKASEDDLKESFGTDDVYEIAGRIIKEGEILTTQEYRDAEQEKKFKQIVDFLSRNAIDPRTGNPHTPERIKSAIESSHVNIKNVPIEKQINEIIGTISTVLPIKIETKRIKINIPAVSTGRAYGIINEYKEKENWLSNGDLEVVIKIPAGIVPDFYDKLNSITHGSAITEEIKEKNE
jgi:ribosome maturation protein SDO1